MPGGDSGGQRQVGGDLPERDQRVPVHGRGDAGRVGPRNQSGWWNASSQDHQTIGSEVFCRYTARGSVQPGSGGVSSFGALTKRTVLPPW